MLSDSSPLDDQPKEKLAGFEIPRSSTYAKYINMSILLVLEAEKSEKQREKER